MSKKGEAVGICAPSVATYAGRSAREKAACTAGGIGIGWVAGRHCLSIVSSKSNRSIHVLAPCGATLRRAL